MKAPLEQHASSEITARLAELFGSPPKTTCTRVEGASIGHDFIITVSNYRFVVEFTTSAAVGRLAHAVGRLRQSADALREAGIPLIVVPFMGDVGRELCERFGISWLDLSGNAKIVAPGARIWIEGRPNKYKERGRPPNVFAPKSSRIARQLLLHPRRFQSQAELARKTGLGDGYVSIIVRRLKQEHYVDADEAGAVRARDPDLLLDAWHGAYDFNRHRAIKGHVPARSGDELLHGLAEQLARGNVKHAFSGLAAAWLLTSFAAFRLVTVYVQSMPSHSLLKEIEFSDEPKGANLWLVLPDDIGVFDGSQQQTGIPCVSPIQTFLDLKAQPERAKDAAVELRRMLLDWERNGN